MAHTERDTQRERERDTQRQRQARLGWCECCCLLVLNGSSLQQWRVRRRATQHHLMTHPPRSVQPVDPCIRPAGASAQPHQTAAPCAAHPTHQPHQGQPACHVGGWVGVGVVTAAARRQQCWAGQGAGERCWLLAGLATGVSTALCRLTTTTKPTPKPLSLAHTHTPWQHLAHSCRAHPCVPPPHTHPLSPRSC